MVKIIIHGSSGAMGQELIRVARGNPDIELIAGIDPAGGDDLPVFSTLSDCDLKADVIVDFSAPETLPSLLKGAVQKKMALVIATTGHSEEDRELIREKAGLIPIFQAANMSLGINLMSELLQKAASVLGESFGIEIVEKHHNAKKDAPSGTAYALAEAINEVFLKSKRYVFGRHTRNERRSPDEIGIHAVRGGTIVGEHQVFFAGNDEVLEIRHQSFSRRVFAVGALQAANYIKGRPPGYYSMKDMIVENSTITNLYRSDEEALISINRIPQDSQKISVVFEAIGKENINLDMISQTAPVRNEVNVSFTLRRQDVDRTLALIRKFQKSMPDLWVDVMTDITKIAVEGSGMEMQSGVAAGVFRAMADIPIHSITTSETKIACVIPQRDADRAVQSIKKFFNV